jgi:hypothetical protein
MALQAGWTRPPTGTVWFAAELMRQRNNIKMGKRTFRRRKNQKNDAGGMTLDDSRF